MRFPGGKAPDVRASEYTNSISTSSFKYARVEGGRIVSPKQIFCEWRQNKRVRIIVDFTHDDSLEYLEHSIIASLLQQAEF